MAGGRTMNVDPNPQLLAQGRPGRFAQTLSRPVEHPRGER